MDRVEQLRMALPKDQGMPKVIVEVCVDQMSKAQDSELRPWVMEYLQNRVQSMCGDTVISDIADVNLKTHVNYIVLNCSKAIMKSGHLDLNTVEMEFFFYQLNSEVSYSEELDEENLPSAQQWNLPSAEFDGLWESLVYDGDVKVQLLNYVSTTILFAERFVDPNIISCNKVVLLHGPPGTGKTSLCKALSQKLSIRLSQKFRYGFLVEINSHSLFSKWFSESGKLVMKMFQRISELTDDREALVCILIDEVESLTAARKAVMHGTEPTDSIRVVNALLTQIDQIKRKPNVLILTTSNITGAIDLAFIDRADIKQYLGPPTVQSIYCIYLSALHELMQRNIIVPHTTLLDVRLLDLVGNVASADSLELSLLLRDIAVKSLGLSGRALRKIPFLAHALYVQDPSTSPQHFLQAMSQAVDKYLADASELGSS